MKVSSEKQENSVILLTIEVDPEQVEQALQKTARKISQKTNIPGFRRGKAPYHIVLQTFGRPAVLEEAVDDLGQEVFEQALKELNIEPYAQAKVVDMQLEPLVLKLRVPVAPTVELGDYRQLRLDAPPVEVTEEQVDAGIAAMREQNATWAPADRPAEWGDRVTLTYVRNQAKPTDPMDLVLKEDTQYPMPGFHARLVGATAGAELKFDLTYPADWAEESLRGQIQGFVVQVQEVKQKELPEMEELPALIGDYEDLDGLKAGTRKDLLRQAQQRSDAALLQKAIDALIEQAKIEYPQEAEDEELERLLSRQDTRLKQQGMDLETYLSVLKVSRDEYKQQQQPAAAKTLKASLILGELAKTEGLRIERDDLERELDGRIESAQRYLEPDAANEMEEMLRSTAGQRYVASELIADQAYARLLAIVKGEAPELTPPADVPVTAEPADVPAAAEPVEEAAPASDAPTAEPPEAPAA